MNNPNLETCNSEASEESVKNEVNIFEADFEEDSFDISVGVYAPCSEVC